MLGPEETYIYQKRVAALGMDIRKSAKKGVSVCCLIDEMFFLRASLCTVDSIPDAVLDPYRIFEEQFETEFE